MRIIGVDPGNAVTGFGVVERGATLVWVGAGFGEDFEGAVPSAIPKDAPPSVQIATVVRQSSFIRERSIIAAIDARQLVDIQGYGSRPSTDRARLRAQPRG